MIGPFVYPVGAREPSEKLYVAVVDLASRCLVRYCTLGKQYFVPESACEGENLKIDWTIASSKREHDE